MSQAMLPPGFRLRPTDEELILYYLKRKVMGKKFQFMAISEVELYKFAPWDLPEMSCLRTKDLEWFFFCPSDNKNRKGFRTNRSTETGYWKTTGKDRTIVHDSRVVGMKKSLVFHTGRPPRGERTDWVMYEYRLSDDRLAASGVPQDAYVICKIFKKSGLGPKLAERYGAPFNEKDWEDDADLEASVAAFPFLPSTDQPSNDNHAIATTSVADCVPVPVVATAMVEPVPESTASISSISEPDEEFSDHDGSLHHGEKKKRLSIEQVRTLEKSFEIENKLEPERKIQLAKALGLCNSRLTGRRMDARVPLLSRSPAWRRGRDSLPPRQVAFWFQNMRAKSKTKQLERDYDALKRQLEAVRSEKEALVAHNKKLQSELGETIESFQRSYRVGDSPVYGRENEKNSIIEFLLADDFNRNNLTVVCIVGESGIGKTSIVQLIYSEERVLDSFDARMLITMPEKSDETRLIKKLIESVTSSSCPMTEADLLEELLIDELSGTKVFVVLDDAENENPCFWNRIINILNHSTRGSVLLVTTKSKHVAEVIGASQTYYLNPLSDYYCWKIFWQHIFTGLNTNANTDLVETGKQLVSKCQHNPLCIKVLAGLLVFLKNEKSWVEILKTDLWNMDGFDGDTLPTLRVGYELLPNDLKKCLHYCSLFPKDYAFAKQQIVRMWMSQGFIISMEGRQPEEVGLQYFDELLLRGFFQHSPLHDVEEDKFIMHDLIRALATNLSRKKGLPAEDALERIFENCFHFSLNPTKIQMDEMEPLINSDLQSFLALTRFSLQTRINISILDITSLSDLFTKCINIRTLDLSCTDIVELPSSVGMLKQLRYLCVNNTKIRSIPRDLCSLVSLQTLEAKGCQHLVELPESMMELTNLRHLDVSKKSGHVKMMIGIGQLTNLQSLAVFCVGCEMPYCSIRELKDLNCLSSCLQIAGLENIRNGLDAKEAALHNKVHLNTLWMHWDDNRTCIESEESVTISEEVLKNLKPNPQIGELIIRNYRGNLFPTWMGDPSFSKLVSIILDNCIKCSQFPALGGLPSLRNLSAQKLYHLVSLENTDINFGSQNTPKFPSLETLNLWEMYDLEELFETSARDFPCLRTLSISRCPMLKRIPYFSSLLTLSLYCCVKLPYLPNFPSLKSLRIDGFQKIKSLELPKDLPALKELEIRHCNELLLVEGLTKLPSLEKLNVVHCPKLDSLKNWKPCHSIPISTTRWFFQKEESTTQMEHQETTEPAEKHTEGVVMALLDDSKKRTKALKTAEPAEKRTKALKTAEPAEKCTKALKTAEPVEKHTKVVVQLGSLDDSKKRTKALKTAVSIEGIISVSLDGNRLVVVCDDTDLIAMITRLRKKLGYAELVSVTSERIREEQENKMLGEKMDLGATVDKQVPIGEEGDLGSRGSESGQEVLIKRVSASGPQQPARVIYGLDTDKRVHGSQNTRPTGFS